MASYRIELRRSAQKDLQRIAPREVVRIVAAIESLAEDPRPRVATRLAGRDKRWRRRLGDYRILYTIDDPARLVIVHNVKHRREAYR